MRHPNILGFLILGAIVIVAAAGARATTFVDLDATALATRSQAVVFGRVAAVDAVADPSGDGVWTNITIAPDTVVGGSLPQGSIVVRELGGDLGDHSEHIIGAATYAAGEQVLVFLRQRPDGSYATTAMGLGKFAVSFDSTGTRWATRHLEAGVAFFNPQQSSVQPAQPASTLAFDAVVADAQAVFTAAGLPVSTPAAADPNEPQEYQAPFTLFGPARWFEPDTNQPVVYMVDEHGYPGLGVAASRAAVDDALAVWTDAPAAPLVLVDGGTIPAQAFAGCAAPNRLVFNDPFDEINDPSGCSGVLAIGGYCTSGQTTVHNGVTFHRIVRGKVTFNNGWDACASWSPCALAEVATHELGHTIGLDHTQVASATMAAFAHFDGRCAGLKPDDIAGVNFIYGTASVDLVILPRKYQRVVIPIGQSQTTAQLAVSVRNADQLGAGVTRTAHLVASDGDCPPGTVGTPDFSTSSPGSQDTTPVPPGGRRTAKIPLTFTRAAIDTPNAAAPQRCTIHLSVDAVGSEGQDVSPDNNVLDVPVDVFDPSDDSGDPSRQLLETVLTAVAPVRIRVGRGVDNKLAQPRFTLRNFDIGSFASHIVQMTSSDGDCPTGTIAGVTLPNNLLTVALPPGGKRSGKVAISINASSFTTLSVRSPARCTASLTVLPLLGERDLSNNTVPLVIDVVDTNDY